MSSKTRDRQDDYNFSRETYYKVIAASLEVLPELTELAKDAEHPKGYEVFAQFVKNLADVNDKFVNLQRKQQIMDKDAGIIEGDAQEVESNQEAVKHMSTADVLALLEKEDVSNDADQSGTEGEVSSNDVG